MSIHDLSNTIDQALAAAGLNTRTGPANTVVETIRKALEAARIAQHPKQAGADADASAHDADIIDVEARVVGVETTVEPAEVKQPSVQRGQFLSFEYSSPLGARAYKLYVPASYQGGAPMPLVVMLHGCKQDPDDFARGTRINQVAEEQGFLVAYPAQSIKANGSNCWNWFDPQHQARAGAEPSIIVGIVREIGKTYRVDERSVFVAGLSAGAAMAVILGGTHPDVFAAVAAHSGLPHGAAHDVASAFAAMHGAAPPPTTPLGRQAREPTESSRARPTIVFHGEADATVVPKNGAAIVQQAVSKLGSERGPLTRQVEQRVTNGRRCTRTAHVDRDGLPVVEQWAVEGGGHAWFGGSRAGSFAEPQGPDASREMMRFFKLHVHRESPEHEVTAT
jgi:poly(hydroxyalkanoate) depolymerase family esterase